MTHRVKHHQIEPSGVIRNTLRREPSHSSHSQQSRIMQHRSLFAPTAPFPLAFLLVALALSAGCGSEDGEAGANDKQSGTSNTGLKKKHHGPCSTTQISATGKTFKKVVEYAWDTQGRPIEEKSGPGATDVGAEIYTKKWGYNDKGQVIAEFFETTGADPNFDRKYTYDAEGRKATLKGTHSSYGVEDCKFEYFKDTKDYNLLCNFEYEETDDEGNVTGTVKGTYSVQHVYGVNQITETHDDGKGGTPSMVTRRFDEKGNLTAIELDSSLRGYPEHITLFKYNSKNQMIEKTVDSDADGTAEISTKLKWDTHGNKLKATTTVINVGVDRTLVHDYSCW